MFEKKYEDQVQPILKGLRYPFADQISKSHLFSVGSLHAWPVLLAMLVWMVELIVCCEQLDSANDLESNTVVDQAAQAEKIFFDYLVKAYDVFLAGSDDYAAMDKTLNANFGTPFLTLDRKNKQVIKHVEKISKSCSVLERELATLSHAESPLVVVERERGILEADKEKFQNYLSHIKIKLEKLNDSVSALNDDMTSIEAEMEKLYAEKQELSETVDLQELSPADVDRMNSERDQLVQSLEAARTALDDINKRVWQSEITMQKTMDRLEKSVQDFNTGVYKLDISDKERFPGLVSELELSVQANSRKSMVSIDLLNVCKPSCTSYINAQRNGCHKINDETYALQEKVDTVSWAHLQKQEQVSILASSVECCNTRYQEQKQFIGKQLNLATQEFATLSRTIEKMKMESNQLVLSSSQKLGQVTAEHEKREVLRSASRDKMLNQVVNGLVEVFGFHQKIAGGLDEMKKVVFVEQGK